MTATKPSCDPGFTADSVDFHAVKCYCCAVPGAAARTARARTSEQRQAMALKYKTAGKLFSARRPNVFISK
jgi:hypothetical protein